MRQLLVNVEDQNETSTEVESGSVETGCCSFRGIQWRIKLGVLPPIKSSIDELRRAAADGRRKYADLRRRFLVDPHIMEEGQKAAHLSMDNPLSQDPESIWGRFFRNAELERSIDKDLTRLYPEHGSYFQTPACQAMLRRILLVWSLTHSEHSYRQGMHELLAPLLYVLHVDVTHLSQVKHLFEDLSDDRFDGLFFQDNSLSENHEKQSNISPVGKKVPRVAEEDKKLSDYSGIEILKCQTNMAKFSSTDELDPEVKAILLGSDAYGAEGELGALLSGRFIEHDAYCMFDALLSGQGGAVAMADYFMNYPEVGSASGLPPVIEASAGLYQLLAVTDISLYSHLVELHVEPQFFALRWLRVLFGREFVLQDLLLVWDAIFSAPNNLPPLAEDDSPANNIVRSPRSAFISAIAVSMLLHLRSALLATPDATTCLQRLLNFPQNADVRKLIENAVSLQPLALDAATTTTPPMAKMGWNLDYARLGKLVRSASASPTCQLPAISHASSLLQNQKSSPCSPDRLRVPLPESYWEEKWRTSVLQRVTLEDAFNQEGMDGLVSSGRQVNETISTSCQQHSVSDPDGGTEARKSIKGNCGTSLKSDPDLLSNTTHQSSKNGTFGKAAQSKLLDGPVKSTDSQIESNVGRLSPANGNGNNAASINKVLGSPKQSDTKRQPLDIYCVQSNEKNFSGLTGGQHKSEGMQSEEKTVGSTALGDSVQGLKLNYMLEQRTQSVSDQESEQPVSASQILPGTKSEIDGISGCDCTDMNRKGIVVGEEQSEDRNGEIHWSNHHEESHDCTSKGSVGKTVVHDSQTGGFSAFWRKQKPSAAAHPGKFRWMWNFGRTIPTAKANGEHSKDELPAKNTDSGGKKRLSEENNVSPGEKVNCQLPKSDLAPSNVESDCRKKKIEETIVSPGAKANEPSKNGLTANNIDLGGRMKFLEENNVSPVEEANGGLSKNELMANNIDLGGRKKLPVENVFPEENTNGVLLKDELPPINVDSDGRRGSIEESSVLHAPSDVAVSSLPSLPLVLEKDNDGASCNANFEGSNVLSCSIVSEVSFNPSELPSMPTVEKQSATLRIMGQSMLENIQVLESAFLDESNMLKKDVALRERVEHSPCNFHVGNGHTAALTALTELRKIGNKLIQM